jgi:exodeoxyribonuclease V alpha subunit
MLDLDPSQELAVQLGMTAPIAVITGGPGTGKSTCLRTLLDRFDLRGTSYALCAPTGKAARRMAEATGRSASTVHRLLGWQYDGWTFDEFNPLPYDVIIVDESSMLDVELAAAIVDALHPSSRLLLVGDAQQLPSVGPGRVLADLVESNAVPVARLKHVHRAAAESWICTNAPLVLDGRPLDLAPRHDFHFYAADDTSEVAALVQKIATRPEYAGAQVLVPQRPGACGVEQLNMLLQKTINPKMSSDDEWLIGDRILRRGDRVIHTVNNYKLEVFNGEVGEVVHVEPQLLVVSFGDREVEYTRENALDLQLAYALTVHKSQGSEFAWVICVVHSSHTYMLTRQLFYTAITRAKKGVVIVGNEAGIRAACSSKEPPKRNTTLVQRMREQAEQFRAEPEQLGFARMLGGTT